MGARGPVPKRSSQRRRRNKPDGPPPTSGRGSGRDQWAEYATSIGVEVPEGASRSEIMELVASDGVEDGWHPLAKQWFESLSRSGQSVFYEPSDWAAARLFAESISRELSPQPIVVASGKEAHVEWVTMPPKGASLAAWLKAMSALLVTEGDRRRARVELSAPGEVEEADPDVAYLDEWRSQLGSG